MPKLDPTKMKDWQIAEAAEENMKPLYQLARVDGQFLLRACICNFRTTLADVEALPGIVVRHAQELGE